MARIVGRHWAWAAWMMLMASVAAAQEARYEVKPLEEAPPSELAPAIRAEIAPSGYRVTMEGGKAFLDIWPRKAIGTSGVPGGAEGSVQFPFLPMGELLGAVRYTAEGRDIRDQLIIPGVYTLRFGLQPVDGNHLGASPFRDFGLLIPSKSDQKVAAPGKDDLLDESAKAAGTEHPAALMMLGQGASAAGAPAIKHDEGKELWSVTLPFTLSVEGAAEPVTRSFGIVFDGLAEG